MANVVIDWLLSIGMFAAARYIEKSTGVAKLCKKGAIGGARNQGCGGQNTTINHKGWFNGCTGRGMGVKDGGNGGWRDGNDNQKGLVGKLHT